jgi:hypothetical protein
MTVAALWENSRRTIQVGKMDWENSRRTIPVGKMLWENSRRTIQVIKIAWENSRMAKRDIIEIRKNGNKAFLNEIVTV